MSRVDDIISGIKTNGTQKKKNRVDTIIENTSNGNFNTGVDENYINAFFMDVDDYYKGISNDAKTVGYSNASSLYDKYSSKGAELGTKANTIRAFLNSNKGKIDEEQYNNLTSALDKFDNDRNSISNHLRETSQHFSQWETEDEYNEAVKLGELYSMSSEEIQPYLDKNNSKLEALQKQQSELRSKIQKYNRGDRSQFRNLEQKKAADEQLKKINRQIDSVQTGASSIAYTTMGGQNITWQRLYDEKKQEEDWNALYGEYSAKSDFGENSKYVSTKTGTESAYGKEFGIYSDPTYEYINGNYDVLNMSIILDDDPNGTGPDYAQKHYDLLSKEEKELYNYLHLEDRKNGTNSAEEFLGSMKGILKKRNEEDVLKFVAEAADDHPILASAFSIGANMSSGFEWIGDVISGNAGDTNLAANIATTIRGTVANKVDWEIGNWDAFDFLYNTTMSGVDSATAMLTFGGAGGLALGLSAAAQGTNDALNRGMSNGQAFWNGFFSGVFEGFFESVSIGNFNALKEGATTGFKSFAKNIGKSMLTNASEETLTELANIAYDTLVNGEFANYTFDDLKNGAWKNALGQVLESGASGALMGFGFGTVGSAMSYRQTTKDAKAKFNSKESIQGLVAEALEAPEGSLAHTLAKEYQAKLDAGKSLSGGELARLSEANEQAIIKSDTAKMTTATEARLTELGEAGDVSTIAKAIVKKASGEKLTSSESSALESSKYGQRVANELSPEGIASKGYTSSWAENLGTKRINVESYNQELVEQFRKIAEEQLSAPDTSKVSVVDETPTESKFEVSDDGKTTNLKTGEAVEISKIDSISESGEVNLTLDGGMVVKASDVSFGTVAERAFVEEISKLKLGKNRVSTASANALYQNAMTHLKNNPNMTVSEADTLIKGLAESYIHGAYNFGAERLTTTDKDGRHIYYAGEISDSARQLAYELGQKDSVAKTNVEQKVIDNLKAKADLKGKHVGKVVLEDGANVDESTLTKTQKANLEGIKLLSEISSVEIHVFRSDKNNNYKYTMPNGAVTTANGWYIAGTNQIWIDLNAGNNGEGTMLWTAAHEISHYIKQWSPKQWKAMADLIFDTFAKNNVDIEHMLNRQKDKIKKRFNEKNMPSEAAITDMAYEEFVSDALTDMLTDGSIVDFISKVKQKNKSLAKKILDGIKNLLKKWGLIIDDYKGRDLETNEAKALSQFEDVFKQLQEMYREALMDADTAYATIGSRNLADFSEAKNTDGGELFQYRAMEADESTYRNMLKKWGKMTDAQINNLFTTIDSAMNIIKENLEVLDYAWEADIDDRAFSPVKPNSDSLYQVSLDFSTLCRKRILQQTIQAHLQEALNQPLTREEGIAIRDALMALQEEGRQIEVACALCYVESARMKSPAQIKKFLNNRETVLKEFFAGKSGGSMKAKIAQAEVDAREKLHQENPNGIKGKDGSMLDPRTATLKSMPNKYADEIRLAKKTAKEAYKPTSEEQKLIDVAKGMSISDFTSPEGLENLAKNYPPLFDAYTSYIRNATKSKGIEGDTWWRAGDSQKIGDVLIANMNKENGLRSQSWSDFQVIHILDYIAATIELSTRNAKEQAYSKVPDYVELMGQTGVMINMSLIPTRQFNGKLDYDSVEGMAYKRALELREKYPATAGTICIGIDNKQIQMLLEDITIDYVIPYHKSGMAAAIRKLMHIPTWSQYEDYQSEKNLSRKDAEAQAKKYGVKLLSESDPNYHKHTSFSESFDLEVAKQIVEMENSNPTNKALQKKYGVMYGGYMAMQNAANEYLKLCAERGIAPKFSHENADFTAEDNYWKLLIDRKMVNNATGEIIEQQAIKPIFDEAEVLRILNDELERYPSIKADQDYATRKVTEKFLSGEIKSGMSAKAIAKVMKTPVDNIAKTNILASAEKNQKLTDADLDEYMKVGTKQRTRDKKRRMLESGKKPILTSSEEIISFMNDVIQGKASGEVRAFATVGARFANAIQQVDKSWNVFGDYLELNADALRESYKMHLSPKEKGDIPLGDADFQRIVEYIDDFDGVLLTNYFKGTKEVHFYKETDEGYIRILAVSSNERGSVIITKLIGVSKEKFAAKYAKKIERNTGSPRGQTEKSDASNPPTGARLTAGVLSEDIITNPEEKVKENSENIFSLRETVEENGDLLAMHNITPQLLTEALGRDNLLMPSLAVTNKAFTDFGDISLVFDKSSIDPNQNKDNKLYGADAWTPTQTELKKNPRFDTNKTIKAVNTIKNRIGSKFYKNLFDVSPKQFKDAIAKADGSIYDAYAENIGVQTAYAIEKGLISKVPVKNGAVDMAKLEEQIRSELDTDNGWRQYKQWLNNISDDIITDYDSATNDDILRNMKSQPDSAKPFKLTENGELVVPAAEYSNIDDMRRNKGRLSENADVETKKVAKKLITFARDIAGKSGVKTADVVNAINSAFNSRYNTKDIAGVFSANGININNTTARELQALYKEAVELPTPYFEAKPQRSVGLNEVAVAVIPDNSSKSMKDMLVDKGIAYIEYEAGNKQSRVDALGKLESFKFSERNEEFDEHRRKALETFGTTNDFNITGFVIPSGHKLKLSKYGLSGTQHRLIEAVFDDVKGDAAINKFIQEGNVRIKAAAPGIEIGQIIKPSLQQLNAIERLINETLYERGRFYLDITAENGDNIATIEYKDDSNASDILYDIEAYYDRGKIPKPASSNNSWYSQFAYSLRDVDPIEPTSNQWQRTLTTSEVKAKFPDLWDVSADESEVRNPTQISGTVKSYRKVYDFLKKTGFKGTILDASSGLGYGTKAGIEEYGFDVEDIEPYPDKSYSPKYTDYSSLNKKYDVIISNAVLNVLPQDQRDALVVKMGELLKNGGKMFINVRGDDVKNASSKVAINEDLMEYYISKSGSYQKGFTKSELVAYLKDALGSGFSVTPTTFFGKTSAVVTKSEGQALYSDRDPSSSNRAILANSLESAAQNDIERNKLAEYKEKISLIDAEEKRLAEIQKQLFTKGAVDPAERKALQFEAKQISNRINTYDRQLLKLEATTALNNVLTREKEKARRRQKQKDAEALKRYKEKVAETQRELMERHKESRKKATESRNRTAMRHKIQRVVSELNTLLTRGTKKNHVPEDLKVAVTEVMELFNMDTVGADERVAKYNDLIAKTKDPDVIASLTETRDRIQAQGDKFNARLMKLKSAYDTIKSSADPEMAGGFDEVVSSRIEYVASMVGKTSLRNMTLEQLEAVHDVYTMVLNNIREANSLFKKDKAETIQNYASRVVGEVKEVGGEQKYTSPRTNFIKKYLWDNLKPVYAFEKIGSKTLSDLFEDVRSGEDTWAVDITEAKTFADSEYEKYNYKKWDFDKKYNFKSTTGEQFSLTLDQMLSLYAYSKRPQAGDHLRIGGFVFDDSITTYKEKDNGKKSILKYNVNIASAHQISIDTLSEVIGSLTNEQKAFVDEMQTYLSDVMGAKGNEVSMTLYNIRLFKEKNYFPLKSAKQFMFEQNEVAGEVRIKNSGFTESTVEHANNPIILNNFMDVWANHINDMSMYHSFVVPLENFNRVFNYQTKRAEGMPPVSVKETLQNAYGTHAVSYVRDLITDLNGGARVDPRESTSKKLISLFKKAKVFASNSVVIQQPSAVARALALIDAKYFDYNPKLISHKARWEELKKYAPVAIIKEMGRFDTDMGLSTAEYIKDQKTVMQKAEDWLSKAPAYADELTWVHIWEAVKRETKAKHTDLEVGSEEFLKTAGKRFTEVISKTQVYDSVLSRSANMRSKSAFMGMVTAFMAEPTTTINMAEQGLRLWKRGYKKQGLNQLKGVGASVVLNAALVSLVYAMRDDDEDETFGEKYLGSLVSETIDNLNPLTYFPLVKDAWSLFQGYSVERSDMSLISDIGDAMKGFAQTLYSYDEDMTDEEMQKFKEGMVDNSLKLADGIAAIFGIPAGNIRRDIESYINTYKTLTNGFSTSGLSMGDELVESIKDITPIWGWLPDKQKTDKLYEAIVDGDTTYVDRLKSGYKDDDAYETALRKALRENDPRIKEAAEAKFDGDYDEYERLFDEIEAEGNFEFDTIKSAINTEFNKLGDSDEDEDSNDGADDNKIESIYSTSDINSAFENGDNTSALEIIDDIVKVKTENYINDGETKQDAEKKAKTSVKSSMTSYWKPLYIAAYKNKDNEEMKRIRNILLASGLYGRANDIVKTGQDWIKSSK